ncbi:MAG: DUF177 domain-containing protein [Bacteroidales bacterium]|nr:DUF177 domain-containing protein [Bacteroidales bacterium]
MRRFLANMAMDNMEQYVIAFRSLKDGIHHFEYQINKDFFDNVESSLIEDGDLKVGLEMTKNQFMLKLHFSIEGTIKATCDICLEMFDYPIDCEDEIIVKFGTMTQELDENLYMIAEDEDTISVAQWIYELIGVNMPIRFEHPLDANGNSTCDPEMIKKLNEYLVEEKTDTDKADYTESNSSRTDPRWDALKGLLDNQQLN